MKSDYEDCYILLPFMEISEIIYYAIIYNQVKEQLITQVNNIHAK